MRTTPATFCLIWGVTGLLGCVAAPTVSPWMADYRPPPPALSGAPGERMLSAAPVPMLGSGTVPREQQVLSPAPEGLIEAGTFGSDPVAPDPRRRLDLESPDFTAPTLIGPNLSEGPELGGVASPLEPAPARRVPGEPAAIPSPLELTVTAPEQAQAGSGVAFRISIKNRSAAVVENVVVRCRPGEGLAIEGRTDRAVIQRFGDLPAGDVREVSVRLIAADPGRYCCDFALLTGERELVWKSVCLEIQPRKYSVRINGPAERAVYGRAEFTVKVVNVSTEPLSGVWAALVFDESLELQEVTGGGETQPGRVSWQVGRLRAGEGMQFQAEFLCQQLVDETCLKAEIGGDGLPGDEALTYLQIHRPVGVLLLDVRDRADPIDVGDETAYEVHVENRGLQTARNVRLVADLPEAFELVTTEVRDGDRILNVAHKLEQGRLSFDPLPTLASEASIVYLIQLKAVKPGDVEFHAHLNSGANSTPITVSEQTTINDP